MRRNETNEKHSYLNVIVLAVAVVISEEVPHKHKDELAQRRVDVEEVSAGIVLVHKAAEMVLVEHDTAGHVKPVEARREREREQQPRQVRLDGAHELVIGCGGGQGGERSLLLVRRCTLTIFSAANLVFKSPTNLLGHFPSRFYNRKLVILRA